MTTTTSPAAERMEFKTEVKQLLNLVVHSLYTKNEIFLRELVSNAADAIDKLRFEGLTNHALLDDGGNAFKIELIPDESAGTLTIRDNGIGMDRAAVVDHLGTIAKSGTATFLKRLQESDAKNRPELIGQFGVGFYSAFMVADRVTVVSRLAGTPADQGVRWESDGQGEFSIEQVDKPPRGTDVFVHLKEDAKEFLKDFRLREIVKRYSDFIEHPIELVTTKDGTETRDTLNSQKAIWLRPKSEVKDEEYNSFYKSVSHDFEDPLATIHYSAEGATEFRALLFVPKRRPFDMMWRELKPGVALYVRRVLIQPESEDLLPRYLRFVKGVVDSADLPLNVSRETLQHNPVLAKIRTNLVNRVLKTLEDLKNSEYDAKYVPFYNEFGLLLKEGVTDWSNRERVADLLLFESTKTEKGELTTLEKYVAGMGVGQTEIYYLSGDSREAIEHSPLLERFRADGKEVLLLSEPADEFVVDTLREYKGKKLVAVDRADAEEKMDDLKQHEETFKGLLGLMKEKLGADVKDVRLTARLTDSAAVLVNDAGAMPPQMERMLRQMGRGAEVPATKKILELNPAHPTVQAVQKLHERNATDPRAEQYGRLLYEQAVVAAGEKLNDPAGFAKRVNELIVKTAE
ncbi:MAG TPA: molecular chaperone HtpG [Tepidisphaeraceae bacterium]|nr:molecular chaperone HtpG [Tepidisphaeraceae bacterium]